FVPSVGCSGFTSAQAPWQIACPPMRAAMWVVLRFAPHHASPSRTSFPPAKQTRKLRFSLSASEAKRSDDAGEGSGATPASSFLHGQYDRMTLGSLEALKRIQAIGS